jgi:hypothetical protein
MPRSPDVDIFLVVCPRRCAGLRTVVLTDAIPCIGPGASHAEEGR